MYKCQRTINNMKHLTTMVKWCQIYAGEDFIDYDIIIGNNPFQPIAYFGFREPEYLSAFNLKFGHL